MKKCIIILIIIFVWVACCLCCPRFFVHHQWRVVCANTWVANNNTPPIGLYCREPNILIVNSKHLSVESISKSGGSSLWTMQVSGIGHLGSNFDKNPEKAYDGFSFAYSFGPRYGIVSPRIYYSHEDVFKEFVFRRINKRNNTCEVVVDGKTFKSFSTGDTLTLVIQEDGSVVQVEPANKRGQDTPLWTLLSILKTYSQGGLSTLGQLNMNIQLQRQLQEQISEKNKNKDEHNEPKNQEFIENQPEK